MLNIKQMTLSEEDIKTVRQEIIENKRPRYLYKYRSTKRAVEFLKNSCIYFSYYNEFNDPFESACKKILDFTPKQYFNAFQRMGQDFFTSAIKAEEIRLGYVDGQDILKQSTDEILKGFSYYCMAKEPNNILMWSHYADSHKGVCFKYDLLQDLDTFLITVPVNYNTEYPEFDALNGNPADIITKKSTDWEYEQEHRVIKLNAHGINLVKREALVEIIFGCKTTKFSKTRIRNLVKNNGFKNVSFSEAVINPETYKLEIRPYTLKKISKL